ncbi:Hypothetical protein PHPALM_2952, partial [Phytophthora palmivora]
MDQMFGPPSDEEVELSQTAVASAFTLSPGDLQDDSEQDAVTGLYLLSEASGLESEGDLDHDQAPAPVSRRRQRTRAPGRDDVNVLLDEENHSDYEDYSSGESDNDGVNDDDSDRGVGAYDGDDDILSDSDAVDLDEAFIASLQLGNNALSRADATEREQTLRAMQWTPVSSQYETNVSAYPGLGTEQATPN